MIVQKELKETRRRCVLSAYFCSIPALQSVAVRFFATTNAVFGR